MRQMADQMEVSTLLEGSIQRLGDQLRISATLVDPYRGRSPAVIWSKTYDHNQRTELPFSIQDQIARSIVESLRVKLDRDPSGEFVQRYTQSPEAYDCYLKGRYLWNRRGAELEKGETLVRTGSALRFADGIHRRLPNGAGLGGACRYLQSPGFLRSGARPRGLRQSPELCRKGTRH